MSTNIWVLIPASRHYLTHLTDCLNMLGPFRDHTVVVTNGPHPLTRLEVPGVHLVDDRTPGVNISRWWNLGLDWIEEHDETSDHHVLILNADARIEPTGVVRLSWALDQRPDVPMAGPMAAPGLRHETRGGFLGFDQRVPGWCFMLSSRHRLRADERFRWWAGDDDLEWRARDSGGTLRVGPIRYIHLGDGIPHGELAELATADLRRFQDKWGVRPF